MVLAACSPYFYAMFTSFEESRQDRIVLKEVDHVALQILVEYVYTSEVQVTEDNVQVLLPAANLLQLTDVRDACCDFLQVQLHPTNCLGIRAFADLHGCLDLLSHAELYIEQHFMFVFLTTLRSCLDNVGSNFFLISLPLVCQEMLEFTVVSSF